jgi:hypothetical protein
MFQPRFSLTTKVAKALMAIEADRQVVASLALTAPMLDSLRRTARLLSTHFSTQNPSTKGRNYRLADTYESLVAQHAEKPLKE